MRLLQERTARRKGRNYFAPFVVQFLIQETK